MQFDIDYDRAKAMASRMQDFLKGKPEGALTRSSAIEAVALMLGFPNRNTMAATMGEKSSGAPVSNGVRNANVPVPSKSAASPAADLLPGQPAIQGKLRDRSKDPENDPTFGIRIEIDACARLLVNFARRSAPYDAPFQEAIQAPTERGTDLLTFVEEEIVRQLRSLELLVSVTSDFIRAGHKTEKYLREAKKVRKNENHAVALALVKLSLPRAEELWVEEKLRAFLRYEMRNCAADLVTSLARGVDGAPIGCDFMNLVNWPDASGQSLCDRISARIAGDLTRDDERHAMLVQALIRFSTEYTKGTQAAAAHTLVEMSLTEAKTLFDTLYIGYGPS